MEAEHGADVVGHRCTRGLLHFLGGGSALLIPLFDRPALRQVAVHRVVRGGLVGQQVRLHAALEQFGQHIGNVAEQATDFGVPALHDSSIRRSASSRLSVQVSR